MRPRQYRISGTLVRSEQTTSQYTNLHDSLLQFLLVSVGDGGKVSGGKVVPCQTEEGATGEPFGGLPLHFPQSTDVKLQTMLQRFLTHHSNNPDSIVQPESKGKLQTTVLAFFTHHSNVPWYNLKVKVNCSRLPRHSLLTTPKVNVHGRRLSRHSLHTTSTNPWYRFKVKENCN